MVEIFDLGAEKTAFASVYGCLDTSAQSFHATRCTLPALAHFESNPRGIPIRDASAIPMLRHRSIAFKSLP
jgi:hypothetical protein